MNSGVPAGAGAVKRVNRAHYFSSVCVEPVLGNVTLQRRGSSCGSGARGPLGGPRLAPFPYRYTWDFGTEDAAARVGAPRPVHLPRSPLLPRDSHRGQQHLGRQ